MTGKVGVLPNSTGNLTITLGNVAGYISDPPLVVPIETPANPASLTISGPSGPVAEGEMAMFTISANPTINKNIIVEVDVIDFAAKGTDFVDDGNHFIKLPANSPMKSFSVQTKTDSSAAKDGILVATLLDGPGYTHSSPTNNTYAEVRDRENTTPVVLTVSADITEAYQEDDIVFTVTRTGDTTNALDFKYDLTDVEDTINGESLAIPGAINANESSTKITLPTKSAATTYTSAAGVTLRLLSVLDDPDLEYRLGSSTELKVAVNSATKPVITLSIEPNYIARGATFNLVATATPAPIRTTSVKVNLTSEPQTYPINNRYLLEAFRGEQTIEIAANATRGQIAITSTPVDLNPSDGIVDDSDAIINATLQADSNYSIPSETALLTEKVGVLGTLPEVSISTRNLYVREDAGSFEVIIYTRFLPFVGLPLKVTSLTATEAGSHNYLGTYDFSNLEISHQDEIFIHDRLRGIRTTVNINSYPEYRGPGEITLTLADTDYYTASAEASTSRVNIQDAQPYPDRTISINAPERVFEGEDIVITLTNDAPLGASETIDVGFAVASIPDEYYNATDSTSSPVEFTSSSINDTETITIKTVDVANLATNGTIYLRVLPGLNYEPPQPDQIEVQVIAHETLQTLSIAADATTIDEGEDAVFTVSATGIALTEELPVSITVEHQNGGNFIANTAEFPNETKVKTTGSGEVRISTIADAMDETNGSITVSLNESSDLTYLLGAKTTETITIKDNDDDTLPQIAISSETPVSVGENIIFNLTANPAPTGGDTLNVRVKISETGDFLMESAKVTPREVSVDVGISGGVLSLQTLSNAVVNAEAQVTARVISEDTSSGATATYSIGANPVAEVYFAPILSVGDGTKAVERDGAMAVFPITASYDSNRITVYFTPTQSGNFLGGDLTAGATISTELDFEGGTSAMLAVPIANDEVSEPDGSITVSLEDDKSMLNGALLTTYIVAASPGNRGTVMVVDDESLPRISIVADSGGVAENEGPARFMLTTTELSSTTTLMINATPAEDGRDHLTDQVADSAADFSVEFSDPDGDGTYTGLLSVALDNDTTGEPTGNIKLTLNTDPVLDKTYQLGSVTEGKITIWDDDAPELSISAVESAITEGENISAEFLISAKASANKMVTIRFGLGKRGNFFEDAETTKTMMLDFSNGAKTATLRIPIVDNDNIEANGEIRAAFINDNSNPWTYYIAPSPDNIATIAIVDDDSLPEISIVAVNGEVAENAGSAKFMVSATRLFGSTPSLMINATPTEDGGDFLTDEVADIAKDFPVEFSDPDGDGTYTGELSVPLDDDEIGEATGDIKLTINADPDAEQTYRIGTATEGVITIWDNDAPELSISARNLLVKEDQGASVDFIISAKVSPNKDVDIFYRLEEMNDVAAATDIEGIADFIDSETKGKRKTLDLNDGKTEVTISIPIIFDNDDEPNGIITLTLLTLTSDPIIYTAPPPNNSASVNVMDAGVYSGPPIISIEAVDARVEEGNLAEFKLRAQIFEHNENLQPIQIDYSVTQVGNFVSWRTKRTITMDLMNLDSDSDSNSITISIDTLDDDVKEEDGSIRVTLIDPNNENFNLHEVNFTDKVDITDNEPEDHEPDPRISVAEVAVNAILNTLILPDNSSPPESALPSPISATLPTVSVDAVQSQVNEGSSVEFVITASGAADSSVVLVNLNVNPVGDFFDINVPMKISRRIQGQDSVQVTFSTINDTIAEADGRLEVLIIPDSSYNIASNNGTASVIISDAEDRQLRQDLLAASTQAFLPDVVGNMVARSSELISQRIQQGFSEASNVTLNLGGENTLQALIEMSGEMTNKGSVEWREILGESSFAMTLLSGDDFVAPTTIWGIGDNRDLSSDSANNSHTWSGDVFTGQFGIDALIGQNTLTGLSTSITENDIDVESENSEKLAFTLNATALNPYFGWTSPTQNAELRAVAGYGIGEFTIDQADYDFEVLSSRSYSLALAGSKELYSSESILNGTTSLKLIGDSWFARQNITGQFDLLSDLQTDAHFLRISTEGSHQFEFERGLTFTPLLSIGIRRDQKNHLSLFGLELISGFDYRDPIGLTLSGSGSVLLGSENEIQKMSMKGSVEYDYGRDELGLTFALSPTWGQTQAAVQNSLWSSEILANSNEVGQYTNGTQVSTEIGYGFALGDESRKLNLYSNYEFDAETDDELLLGTSLSIGSKLGLDFEQTNKIGSSESAARKYQFNARLSW